MFDQTFVDGVGKTNKSWTVTLSFTVQIGIIAVLVILPLIFTDVLPKAQLVSLLQAPAPPPPPPPPPPPTPVKVVKVPPRQFDAGKLMAPKEIPKPSRPSLRRSFRLRFRTLRLWSASPAVFREEPSAGFRVSRRRLLRLPRRRRPRRTSR